MRQVERDVLRGAIPAGRALGSRIEEILRSRLTAVCIAILVVIPLPLVYTLFLYPAPVSSVFGGLVWVSALVMRWRARTDRLPPGHSGLYMFGLWVLCLSATVAVFEAYHDPIWAAMVLLLLASQGAIQLQLGYFLAADLIGGFAWFTMQASEHGGIRWIDLVAFSVATTLGALSFVIGRRYVEELESRTRAVAVALGEARQALAERHDAEAERERLRAQFVDAQKLEAVGTLAGGLAHDVNNLLTGILGLAQLVRDETKGQARDDVDQIIATCNRGGQMTRNLLGFSRRGQYRREVVHLEDVAAHVAALLDRTAPKRIRVRLELDGNLDVDGDGAQLSQALLNLCLNSIDAIAGDGQLVISARGLSTDDPRPATLGLPPGSYVSLAVRDDGAGMDEETARHIFEPFFTTKGPGKGTGLGLAMVYGTARAHGGQVAVTSTPGTGTEIVLLLPAMATSSEQGAGAATGDRSVATSTPAARIAGRLLVVDDDPVVRSMAKRLLSRHGYEVDVAENGAEAVRIYPQRAYAVVILDMSMPVMDGGACFHALRELDPDARIVLASGYALQEETRRLLAAGALGFLNKPYALATLLSAVKSAAQGQRVPALAESS